MRIASDLPFASEFSPSRIELSALLCFAVENDGNAAGLDDAIRKKYYSAHGGNDDNRKKLAMNCRLGMKAYGIIDGKAHLTDFGRKLHALKEDEQRLYHELGRHILLNLNGMLLVQCIRDMMLAGEKVTLDTLRSGLAERGAHFPKGASIRA